MKKLPYACKEMINMYYVDKIMEYPAIKTFNEVIDYEPCAYSPHILQKMDNVYKAKMRKNNKNKQHLIDKYKEELIKEMASYLADNFMVEILWRTMNQCVTKQNCKSHKDIFEIYRSGKFCGNSEFSSYLYRAMIHESANLVTIKFKDFSYPVNNIYKGGDVLYFNHLIKKKLKGKIFVPIIPNFG